MTLTTRRYLKFLAIAAALLPAHRVEGQAAATQPGSTPAIVPPAARMATRTQLEATAAYYDRLATSPAYGERTRARARSAASTARRRLTDGDFRIGDQIIVVATGSTSAGGNATTPSIVQDTLTVLDGKRLSISGYPAVSLQGALRSELEARLLSEMTALVRSASVTARPLMRIAVFGEVGAPGYLSLPQETTLDQVITRAGGPLATAATEKITLMRADTVLMKTGEFQTAVAQGRTLDALGLEDGDILNVPATRPPWDRNTTFQILGMVMGPLVALGIFR